DFRLELAIITIRRSGRGVAYPDRSSPYRAQIEQILSQQPQREPEREKHQVENEGKNGAAHAKPEKAGGNIDGKIDSAAQFWHHGAQRQSDTDPPEYDDAGIQPVMTQRPQHPKDGETGEHCPGEPAQLAGVR